MSDGMPPAVWLATIGGFLAIVAFDLLVVARKRGRARPRSAIGWLAGYITLACLFGAGLAVWGPPRTGGEFFAGYVTEYSLSVDNLFVFLIVITRMQVPEAAQDTVIFIGIAASMVLRAALIVAGTATISAASWTFYILGAFLLYTAVALALEKNKDDEDIREQRTVMLLRRVLPLTEDYAGTRLTVRDQRGLKFTPLVLAIAAIAVANVVFALDSIPAIFGLTTNTFVVLCANAFALLGLRQLYFVVETLLARLRYLRQGLVAILGFIGVKLLTEAMWSTHLRQLGFWQVPQISTPVSLLVIVGVLIAVGLASVVADHLGAVRTRAGGSGIDGSPAHDRDAIV
ncbi:MAG TPA: TerC/Alx family metal homeostasis membrane protein [Trebonia sp.]|jgi:TerC family integral membrane protein|nr:TerC/Alx family metal homeostasis membrane protein [Trebonia sp.]